MSKAALLLDDVEDGFMQCIELSIPRKFVPIALAKASPIEPPF